MATFVALLRAINVGGTGLLPMKDLAVLCTGIGVENVRTYIQSGNVVFETALSENRIQTELEQALTAHMGKKIDVVVRSASDLRSILQANPFPDAMPAKVAVVFLSRPAPKDLLHQIAAPGGEEVRLGKREIYIFYPNGMGKSKLKLPSALGPATARNINTVGKLAAMAASQ